MMFWCRDLFFAVTKSFIRQNFCILKNAFCFGLEPATQCGYLNRVIDISEYKKRRINCFSKPNNTSFSVRNKKYTFWNVFLWTFYNFFQLCEKANTRHIKWLERFVKVPPRYCTGYFQWDRGIISTSMRYS